MRRAGCALAAAAFTLVLGSGRASAHLDGAGLFVLPPDRVVIRQAPCLKEARRESSRGVAKQLWAFRTQADRMRETSVVPRFWGFHGIGVEVRGKL